MATYETSIKTEAGDTLKYLQEVDANISRKTYNLLMMSAVAVHTDSAAIIAAVFSSDDWKTRGNIASCASVARQNAAPLAMKYSAIISQIIAENENIILQDAGQLFAAELSGFGFTALHHFKSWVKDGMLSPKEQQAKQANAAKEAQEKQDALKEAQQRALDAAEERAKKAEEALKNAPLPEEAPEEAPEEEAVIIGENLTPNAAPFPVSPVVHAEEPASVPSVQELIKAFALLDNPEFFTAYNAIKAMAEQRRKDMKKAA